MTQTLEQLSAAATELLPCPFCGGDAHWSPTYVNRDTPGTVECANGCGATVITSGSKAKRIAAWNTRTGQLVEVQADDATVEKVKDAIGTSLAYDIGMDVRAGSLTDDEKRKVARKAIAAMKGPKL